METVTLFYAHRMVVVLVVQYWIKKTRCLSSGRKAKVVATDQTWSKWLSVVRRTQ